MGNKKQKGLPRTARHGVDQSQAKHEAARVGKQVGIVGDAQTRSAQTKEKCTREVASARSGQPCSGVYIYGQENDVRTHYHQAIRLQIEAQKGKGEIAAWSEAAWSAEPCTVLTHEAAQSGSA